MSFMKFDVLTLFPEQIENNINESITGRAVKRALYLLMPLISGISAATHTARSMIPFTAAERDFLYTASLFMTAGTAFSEKEEDRPYTVYVSPKGSVLDQKKAIELSKKKAVFALSAVIMKE